MKKILSSKRGEMYIEAIVTMIVIMAFMLFALSTFRVASAKSTADTVADNLLEIATFYGAFGTEFDEKVAELKEQYPGLNFEVSVDGEWHNVGLKRVQLGDTMKVVISYEVSFGGFGSVATVDLTSVRTGASENYWKS